MELERDLAFNLFTVLVVVSLSQVCFVIFPMDTTMEQRMSLKFYIANGIPLQKAYGEPILSKTRAYEWYSASKSGRDVVEYFGLFVGINVLFLKGPTLKAIK